MNNCDNDTNGIAEILRVIALLQKNACPSSQTDSCDRPVLGGSANCIVCNTRPIILYTTALGNTPLSMPTSRANINCDVDAGSCSNVFRVERVDESTCTCRVLVPSEADAVYPYLTTDSTFTINLSCLCVLRCLPDTYVEGVC